ncbi:MAG: D-alanyl-D-alanine carboxypeptidase/D-alanyl-D-alanine-endopeptidase [Pyrinomonadaceae bacterium]
MKYIKTKIALILTLTVIGFNVDFTETISAQVVRDDRVITATTTPTPKNIPAASPTPFPSPTPFATPAPKQNLSSLQSQIRQVLFRPEFRRGSIGVKIVSLDTGKTVFEQDAEKYFMPASNMKSFTVAAAMEKLTPNFRFVTSVFANSAPDVNGTISGDLTIYGRGDISISTAFYDGDYYKGIDELANRIAQTGVKRIEGNLVGDETFFSGSAIPSGWEWDDLQWYYGAEVSALPLNDNSVDLSIKPGAQNSPCFVQIQPTNTLYKIINRCATTDSRTRRDIRVIKKLDQNILEVYGTMPNNDGGYTGAITISHPSELFVEILRQRLLQKGITVTGRNLVKSEKPAFALTVLPVEIARLESVPFSIVAAKTMKPSQNLYTETILWTLGEQVGRKQQSTPNPVNTDPSNLANKTSSELGIGVVQDFLRQIGVAPDSVLQYDGSGLSRHDLITPSAAVQLYTYMAKQSPNSAIWQNSLTIGGVDGTLRNRFKGTKAENNMRGKTGTIDQVSALSGYVTTAAGEKLVLSILVNGVPATGNRTSAIDSIVVALANFDGRTQ